MNARELVYKFIQLPWHVRYEIIKDLKVLSKEDLEYLSATDEQLLEITFFRLIRQKNKIKELETKLSNISL
jgi:hypothetical protein